MKSAWWFGCCLAVAATSVQAQREFALPDALKGMNQSTGTCKRAPPPGSTADRAASANDDKVDAACLASVSDVIGLVAKGPLTIVDVRLPAVRELASIDGALGLTATEIKTKAHLRSRPVVLVGDGKGQRELVGMCASLKVAGFVRPMVLNGGMPAWTAQGQPTVGRLRGDVLVTRLSSAELWAESQYAANIVVVSEELRLIASRLVHAEVLPLIDDAGLRRIVEQRKKRGAVASVVIAASEPMTDAGLARLRDALKPVPVLAYVGSAGLFAQDMKRLEAQWAAQARGPKQPACGA